MKKSAKTSRKPRKPLANRLADLAKLGHSGPAAYRQLVAEGYDVSERSVGRKLRDIRGPQRVARRLPATDPPADPAPPPAGALPTEEEIAVAAPETLEQWAELAGRSARAAESRGDLASVARFGNLATSIAEAMRKARPKEPPPEGVFVTMASMQAEAAKGEGMLEKLATALFDGSEHWPVCPSCKRPIPPADLETRIEGVSK
jgi:hypothetical protein